MIETYSIKALRKLLDDLLEQHMLQQGKGPDAYWEKNQDHPMADAKYLMAVSQCYCSGLLGRSKAESFSKSALKRLKEKAISLEQNDETKLGWGLGFPWPKHGYKIDDPLLINSAVVSKALQLQKKVKLLPKQFMDIHKGGMNGINWWIDNASSATLRGPKLPVYGLSNYREPIFNTAAYSLSLIHNYKKNKKNILSKINFIAKQYKEGAGWTYSEDNPVIDLLHQWYILNSLMDCIGSEPLENQCRAIFSHFSYGEKFIDVITLKTHEWKPEKEKDLGYILTRPIKNGVLVIKNKPARLWSLGEMLLGISKICHSRQSDALWHRYGQKVAQFIYHESQNKQSDEWNFPRHTMHLAHGISAYLAYCRDKEVI